MFVRPDPSESKALAATWGILPAEVGEVQKDRCLVADYLPTRESELLLWVDVFQTKIGAAPASFGISLPQSAGLTANFNDFEAKYLLLQDSATRTPLAIENKDQAKDKLLNDVNGVRKIAQYIQNNPATTDSQRVDLGLPVHDDQPSPVPAPVLSPQIDMQPPVVRTVRIRLHNEQTLGHRRKPEGVAGATIFSFVGPLPPALDDVGAWKFEMNTGKTTEEITFPSTVAAGATVWITASWYNQKGEQGPATPAVNVNLPGTLQEAA